MCIPDFDEPTGFCDEDSPRKAEVEAARAEQAAVAWKGIADAFGLTGAAGNGLLKLRPADGRRRQVLRQLRNASRLSQKKGAGGPRDARGPPT